MILTGYGFQSEDRTEYILPCQCDRGSTDPGVGIVNVTRSRRSDDGCFTWTITFTTAVGDIEQVWWGGFFVESDS
jgi:hypothetical protein